MHITKATNKRCNTFCDKWWNWYSQILSLNCQNKTLNEVLITIQVYWSCLLTQDEKPQPENIFDNCFNQFSPFLQLLDHLDFYLDDISMQASCMFSWHHLLLLFLVAQVFDTENLLLFCASKNMTDFSTGVLRWGTGKWPIWRKHHIRWNLSNWIYIFQGDFKCTKKCGTVYETCQYALMCCLCMRYALWVTKVSFIHYITLKLEM